MSGIQIDFERTGIDYVKELFQFKGMSLAAKKVNFHFTNTVTEATKTISIDYDEALWLNINSHLKVISLLMLNFEDVVSDIVLIERGLRYGYLTADMELSEREKLALEENKRIRNISDDEIDFAIRVFSNLRYSASKEVRNAEKLVDRLVIKSITADSDHHKLTIKGEKFKNKADLEDRQIDGSENFFDASAKGSKISYLPVGIGEEEVDTNSGEIRVLYNTSGEFTPFFPELRVQFKELEKYAMLFMLRELRQYAPTINAISLIQSIDEVNTTVAEAKTDSDPLTMF